MSVAEATRVPYPKAMRRFPEIRQTLLGTFDACALSTKFDLEYARGWSTHPQARGTIFHRFAGRALLEMAALGERSIEVDVALAILHEVLRQDDIDRECPECGAVVLAGTTKGGMRRCAKGHRFETEFVNVPMAEVKDLYMAVIKWAHDNSFDVGNLVAVEERLRADISYEVDRDHIGMDVVPRVTRTLTGKLDALFIEGEEAERAIVLDWKDTWALPPKTAVSFEGYFQQRFYGWLVMRNYRSVQSVTLREFYDRYSEPREATVWRSSLDDVEAELAALAQRFDRAYEEEIWRPSPGHHCHWCLRPTACPIPAFARGPGRITDEKRAVELAGQRFKAAAILDQIDEALKSWAEKNGPIRVRGQKGFKQLGYRRRESVSRPTREEMEQALGRGEVDLDKLYKTRTQTRWETYVPKPDETPEGEEADLLERLQESVLESQRRRNGK